MTAGTRSQRQAGTGVEPVQAISFEVLADPAQAPI